MIISNTRKGRPSLCQQRRLTGSVFENAQESYRLHSCNPIKSNDSSGSSTSWQTHKCGRARVFPLGDCWLANSSRHD